MVEAQPGPARPEVCPAKEGRSNDRAPNGLSRWQQLWGLISSRISEGPPSARVPAPRQALQDIRARPGACGRRGAPLYIRRAGGRESRLRGGGRASRLGCAVSEESSVAAIGTALPGNAFYAATKAEVAILTRRFAMELDS